MDLQALYEASPGWVQTIGLNLFALRIHRERYGSRFEQLLEQLMQSDRWSPDQHRDFQETRLRAIVTRAYETVPYYRELMDGQGLEPDDIRRLEDLPKLPLLTREAVATRHDDLLSSAVPRRGRYHGHTSGTTGSPLSFVWDQWQCIVTNAVDWRQKLWAGLRRDDWYAVALGRKVVPLERDRPPFWRANHVHKQLWLSSFHMSERTLDDFFVAMRERGVRALEGYPSTCYVLALHLVRQSRTFPLRCVLTSSETLHPLQRETIERAFECEVFDFYGLAERTIFATECEEHCGHHVNLEFGITEIVDDQGIPVSPGSPGFLVGTSLHNGAMPFLRYRTNDVTRLRTEGCPCGRTLPLMDDVATKAEDIVVTPEGRYISPSTLTHPFKPLHSVRKSQVLQLAPGELLVKLAPYVEVDEGEVRNLVESLKARVGDSMRIDVEVVDDIPPEQSGKYRWVVSRVAKERADLDLWNP